MLINSTGGLALPVSWNNCRSGYGRSYHAPRMLCADPHPADQCRGNLAGGDVIQHDAALLASVGSNEIS